MHSSISLGYLMMSKSELVQRDSDDKRRNPYAYTGYQKLRDSCVWARLKPILPFIKMGHVVADFGCGLGWNTKFMSLFCKKVIGIDKSQSAIDTAICRSGACNVEWICGDMSSHLLEDSFIDIAVSIQSIEHLNRTGMESFFESAYKALKPEGILLGCTTEFRFNSVENASYGHRFEPGWNDFVDIATKWFVVVNMKNRIILTWDREGENIEGFFILQRKGEMN